MFISSTDKKRIEVLLDTARHNIALLEKRVAELEQKLEKPVPAKRIKKPLTAAQRAKQRQYQKAYNERQKAKKLAAKLEQGTTNVSA